MLPKIGSEGFSNVGGKWKAVVVASLAAYGDHAGPPIDIVELQNNDFACPQPQSGQEEKDCLITTTDGAAQITSLNNSFDLFRLEVPWHFFESPCGHSRNGPCEVTFRFAVLKEKSEEGTEGRHHQLGCSGTTGTGAPQQETRNIVRN